MILALILFEIFNTLDFVFTYQTVIVGGVSEANMIVNWAISTGGTFGLFLMKLMAGLLGIWLYLLQYKALYAVTGIYGLLTCYHIFLIWV